MMTVNCKIKQALSPFGIQITTDFYGGKEKEYFTFNYADDHAADFGDNAPQHVVAYMQIHWFFPRCKRNYLDTKKRIRMALFRAGFTFPRVTEMVDGDDKHLIFECEIEDEDALADG